MKVLKIIFISLLLIFNVSVIESASLASMPCSAGAPQDNFYDGFENGLRNWSSVLLNPWEISNLSPNSGTYSLRGINLPTVSNTCIKMKTAVTVPANAFLNFIHAYDLDCLCDPDVECEYYDGGIVEYSTSGGLSWIDAGALFTENGYNGTISSDFDNPLSSKNAFVGSTNDYISTKLNLNDLAGENVIFRFCIGTDSENYETFGPPLGWFIDDVRIYTCDNTITTTAVPTTTTSLSTATTVPTNSTTVPPTTTTTVPVNIINATSLLKQISGPIIFDKKNVWMILSAAGHHFNRQASSITIEGPGEGSQGVSLNKLRKVFSVGKLIFVPLTIQKGATSGEWIIEITTRLSNPAQEEKVTATINIQTASTTVPPTTTTTSVPSSTTTSILTSTTSAALTTTTTVQPTTTTSSLPVSTTTTSGLTSTTSAALTTTTTVQPTTTTSSLPVSTTTTSGLTSTTSAVLTTTTTTVRPTTTTSSLPASTTTTSILTSTTSAVLTTTTISGQPTVNLGLATGNPCNQVSIPITLINDPEVAVAAVNMDIGYNSTYLTPVNATIGPAGRKAGKSVSANIVSPGLFRIRVFSSSDITPIGDGIVAFVKFEINCGAPANSYLLTNTPSAETPEGVDLTATGSDGTIIVEAIVTTTTTSMRPSSTSTTTIM